MDTNEHQAEQEVDNEMKSSSECNSQHPSLYASDTRRHPQPNFPRFESLYSSRNFREL